MTKNVIVINTKSMIVQFTKLQLGQVFFQQLGNQPISFSQLNFLLLKTAIIGFFKERLFYFNLMNEKENMYVFLFFNSVFLR